MEDFLGSNRSYELGYISCFLHCEIYKRERKSGGGKTGVWEEREGGNEERGAGFSHRALVMMSDKRWCIYNI